MSATSLSVADQRALWRAVSILERDSFVGRLSDLTGEPITGVLRRLPDSVTNRLNKIVQASLRWSLDVALSTTGAGLPSPGAGFFKVMSVVTGGAGGFLGLAALPVELPVTTTLMLRSIADIARREGENLKDPSARLACIEVFALATPGGRKGSDALWSETNYYATRAFLAKAVSEAAGALAQRGLTQSSAPLIVEVIAAVSSRFGMLVSEKVAAGAIPVAGAIGGAAINLAFMEHFQQLAQAHFSIRRLERLYGAVEVLRVHTAYSPMVRERLEKRTTRSSG